MKRPPSAYAKVAATLVGSVAVALATALPDSAAGKWSAAVVAVLVAMGLVERTRNTQVAEAPGDTQGAAAGGVIEGTTGVVGKVLDGTLGRLIPGGGDGGRHAA